MGHPLPRHSCAGVLSRVEWAGEEGLVLPGDTVALSTPPVFVDSIAQLFTPLLLGAVLLLLPGEILRDPCKVCAWRGGLCNLWKGFHQPAPQTRRWLGGLAVMDDK